MDYTTQLVRKGITAAAILAIILPGCYSKDENNATAAEATRAVVEEFTKLCEIPHASGQEQKISDYLYDYIKSMGLAVVRDETLNIIADKPASVGKETTPLTILQAHIDMVAVGRDGSTFDPLKDAVKLLNDGNALRAQNSSLGADNGIGVSMALYVLKSKIEHGPIRVIFTVDEERGMTGAKELDSKYLQDAEYLINLDGSDDTRIMTGCAGSVSFHCKRSVDKEKPKGNKAIKITLSGLVGGHSGADINLNHANAITELANALMLMKSWGLEFELASFDGGAVANAIPSRCEAVVVINEGDKRKFDRFFTTLKEQLEKAFLLSDPNMTIANECTEMPEFVVSVQDQKAALSFLIHAANGINTVLPSSNGQAQSSSNVGVAKLSTKDGLLLELLGRSFEDLFLEQFTCQNKSLGNILGVKVEDTSRDPAWREVSASRLTRALRETYKELFDSEPGLGPVHGGLEPAWFCEKNPKLEMVTIGPTIKNLHNPEEVVELGSVEKSVKFLIQGLKKFAKSA